MVHIGNDWDGLLQDEFKKDYYLALREFLKREYAQNTVYPDMYSIFNALKYTSYADTKAVLLGQDPYHGQGQAHGLCFSVQKGTELPPSLKNIYKELQDDLCIPPAQNGELIPWAKQGVLMLNTVLTVRAGIAGSHRGQGWEQFTDAVIKKLDEKQTPVVFILWGANARSKAQLITNPMHIKLECAHPSPLSAYNGFFGCRHFSKTNNALIASGQTPIDWRIE